MKKKLKNSPEILTVEQLTDHLRWTGILFIGLPGWRKIPAMKNWTEWRFEKKLMIDGLRKDQWNL